MNVIYKGSKKFPNVEINNESCFFTDMRVNKRSLLMVDARKKTQNANQCQFLVSQFVKEKCFLGNYYIFMKNKILYQKIKSKLSIILIVKTFKCSSESLFC